LFSTEAQAAAALVAIIGGYRLVGLSVEHRDSSGRSTSFNPISARPFRRRIGIANGQEPPNHGEADILANRVGPRNGRS
jgi:hypothetical protein